MFGCFTWFAYCYLFLTLVSLPPSLSHIAPNRLWAESLIHISAWLVPTTTTMKWPPLPEQSRWSQPPAVVVVAAAQSTATFQL